MADVAHRSGAIPRSIVHDIGTDDSQFLIVQAINIDDEIIYVLSDYWPDRPDGTPLSTALRGMEGTVAAPHLEGAEIEYIRATIDPEWAATVVAKPSTAP